MGPIISGNDATIRYVTRAGTGNVQDITGWSLEFRVKSVGQSGFIIDKLSSVPTQILITDPTHGLAEVYIQPADTNALSNSPAQYKYEFRGTDVAGHVYTLDAGPFLVLASLQP